MIEVRYKMTDDYKKGWNDAVLAIEQLAMEDRRGELTKSCGLVPKWQIALFDFGDEVYRMYKP